MFKVLCKLLAILLILTMLTGCGLLYLAILTPDDTTQSYIEDNTLQPLDPIPTSDPTKSFTADDVRFYLEQGDYTQAQTIAQTLDGVRVEKMGFLNTLLLYSSEGKLERAQHFNEDGSLSFESTYGAYYSVHATLPWLYENTYSASSDLELGHDLFEDALFDQALASYDMEIFLTPYTKNIEVYTSKAVVYMFMGYTDLAGETLAISQKLGDISYLKRNQTFNTLYAFDSDGRRISILDFYLNGTLKRFRLYDSLGKNIVHHYEYDTSGTVISETELTEQGKTLSSYYYLSGEKIRIVDEYNSSDKIATQTHYNERDEVVHQRVYDYDKKGNNTRITLKNKEGSVEGYLEYEYVDNALYKSIYYNAKKEKEQYAIHETDSNGSILKAIYYYPDGEMNYYCEYEVDQQGYTLHTAWYTPEGKLFKQD